MLTVHCHTKSVLLLTAPAVVSGSHDKSHGCKCICHTVWIINTKHLLTSKVVNVGNSTAWPNLWSSARLGVVIWILLKLKAHLNLTSCMHCINVLERHVNSPSAPYSTLFLQTMVNTIHYTHVIKVSSLQIAFHHKPTWEGSNLQHWMVAGSKNRLDCPWSVSEIPMSILVLAQLRNVSSVPSYSAMRRLTTVTIAPAGYSL